MPTQRHARPQRPPRKVAPTMWRSDVFRPAGSRRKKAGSRMARPDWWAPLAVARFRHHNFAGHGRGSHGTHQPSPDHRKRRRPTLARAHGAPHRGRTIHRHQAGLAALDRADSGRSASIAEGCAIPLDDADRQPGSKALESPPQVRDDGHIEHRPATFCAGHGLRARLALRKGQKSLVRLHRGSPLLGRLGRHRFQPVPATPSANRRDACASA